MDQATLNLTGSQANAAVSRAVFKFLDARSNGRRFHREAIGDVDPGWCFADYLTCVAANNRSRLEKHYDTYQSKSALSVSGRGSTGGYLVPAELRDDLMGDVAEEAIIRPRAAIVPMTTITLDLPYWDVTTNQSQGVAPFWGGMKMSWTLEAKQPAESEPTWKSLQLKVNELGGTLVVSAPLMQDARGLEAWLRRAFSRSLAWYEDYAFTQGSGSGMPLGLVNAPCAVTVIRQTPNAYSNQDGQRMFNALFGPLVNNAVWLFSITCKGSAVSQSNWFVNGSMKQYDMPICYTLHQPPLGTKGDVIAVDPSLYVIGDRQALEIAASPYTDGTMFKTNQWLWRVIERVDGQPMLLSPITVPDGASPANQVSPIVVLV